MAGRHQSRFPLPGVHSGGQVHAFGNCTDSDVLEEDAEVYELRSRGKEKIRRSTSRDRLDDIVVLTKDIKEGDTLNAIALQYCCTRVRPSTRKTYFWETLGMKSFYIDVRKIKPISILIQ
ncbi:PREDICTED: lysM and putative peptidoglycan-binding domain-containing protein 3-like [Condylura cristata]|uniref:lysM and putative peptidoglycan-binding domain-containing protein 3-like n=1 Tax=Condylura cristata TaxID=143302 RepID=UPI0003347735|nr:PREDICTED: lysM and putative peptidoglycan-binding domain-containing protein 3-like [Condylura cristata]